MLGCVFYNVYRGNSLENAEWLYEELRGLPTRVRPLAQDYEPERSGGWLLMPTLEQAVWFVNEYRTDRRRSYLSPRVAAVSSAAELPGDLDRLMAWLEELAFAQTVLGIGRDDPYYLVHPEGCYERAVDAALLARYAGRGSARLLSASRSTNWLEADGTWEHRVVPTRISGSERSLVRVHEHMKELVALRVLVEQLRLEAPREVDLICEEAITRSQSERLTHLLVLTQGLVARVVPS